MKCSVKTEMSSVLRQQEELHVREAFMLSCAYLPTWKIRKKGLEVCLGLGIFRSRKPTLRNTQEEMCALFFLERDGVLGGCCVPRGVFGSALQL